MVGHFVLIPDYITALSSNRPHCSITLLYIFAHFCTFLYILYIFPTTLFRLFVVSHPPLLVVPWPPFGCKQHLSYNRLLATHIHLPSSCYHHTTHHIVPHTLYYTIHHTIPKTIPYHTPYYTTHHIISYHTVPHTILSIPHSLPYHTIQLATSCCIHSTVP